MHCLAERRPSPILLSTPTDIRQAGQPQHLAHYHFINHTGARALTPFRDEEIGNRPGARVVRNLVTDRAGFASKPALTVADAHGRMFRAGGRGTRPRVVRTPNGGTVRARRRAHPGVAAGAGADLAK